VNSGPGDWQFAHQIEEGHKGGSGTIGGGQLPQHVHCSRDILYVYRFSVPSRRMAEQIVMWLFLGPAEHSLLPAR
jgi:hypothetical protein